MNERQKRKEIIDKLTKGLLKVTEIVLRQKEEEQADLRRVAAGIAKFMKETAFAELPSLNKMFPERLKEFDELTTGIAVSFMLESSKLAHGIEPGQPHLGFPPNENFISEISKLFPYAPPASAAEGIDDVFPPGTLLKLQNAFRLENEGQENERRVKERVAKHFTNTALAEYPALKNISADQIREFGKLVTGLSLMYATQAARAAFWAENEVPPPKKPAKTRRSKKS